MSDLVELMAAPFAACVLLVGIHAYLGLHVIQRKVIFVDLALAQIAALGGTFGYLVGVGPHDPAAYFLSVGFAIAGAAIFALTRMRHEQVPQEAIIGIVYAVALATTILVADRAPEGSEHIHDTLVGVLLWVRWPVILKTAVIYALIGAMHVAFRKRFLQLSFHPEDAFAERRWVRLWDFLFYVTFAFVITSSVAIAGVLLVFSFLVIPAAIAVLFASQVGTRLAIGWIVGIVACVVGLVGSYRLDMPSGPAVVASLALALIVAALLRYVLLAERRRSALARVAAGVTVVVAVVAGTALLLAKGDALHVRHLHEWEEVPAEPRAADTGGGDLAWRQLFNACGDDLDCAAGRLVQTDGWPEIAATRLASSDDAAREQAIAVLARAGRRDALDILARAAGDEPDHLLRVDIARALVAARDRRGAEAALAVLEADAPQLARDDAFRLLVECAGQDFGYDPAASVERNRDALSRWRDWLAEQP